MHGEPAHPRGSAPRRTTTHPSAFVRPFRLTAMCRHVYTLPMATSTELRRAPLEIKGTAEQIADRIRAEIEAGRLTPGAPLNQVDLAARFGLSRIPVREALRFLAAEGYVTYRPNKGANVVGAVSPDDVEEIVEIRECLEARLMDRA